jgi:hypothetical protein
VEVFRDVNKKKNDLILQIQDLDRVEEQRSLSTSERLSKDQWQAEYEKLLLLKEIAWRQKSRVKWLREGDRNTRFFHRVANSNRRINSIDRLSIDGTLTTDQIAIGEGLVNFYNNLFFDEALRRPLLDDLPFSSIDEEDGLVLDRQFTEEEVWGVVKEMAGDKAPRPNGYTMAFFQECWATIKNDVMAIFYDFHTHGSFVRSMIATFLVLIP